MHGTVADRQLGDGWPSVTWCHLLQRRHGSCERHVACFRAAAAEKSRVPAISSVVAVSSWKAQVVTGEHRPAVSRQVSDPLHFEYFERNAQLCRGLQGPNKVTVVGCVRHLANLATAVPQYRLLVLDKA
jgi:hypothetical protein